MKPSRIFEKYRDNINLLIDNSLIDTKYSHCKNHYVCPICLNQYETSEGENPLTLEDAPQKSIGGSKNTLTCKKCNNEAGIKIDHHLVNRLIELDNSKFLPNTTAEIKTNINGEVLNAKLTIDENGIMKVLHSKKNNNPKLIEKNVMMLEVNEIIDFSFITKNIIPDNLDIAVLKSAYIILFQHTGYKVILEKSYDFIREQILNPEKRLLPQNFYLFSNIPIFKDGVHFICEKGLEIILVVFTAKTNKSSRNFCVFLPLPNKNYEDTLVKIFERKHEQGDLRLSAFPEDIVGFPILGHL